MFFLFSFLEFFIFLITSRYRGGGHKRLYRLLELKRERFGVKAKVFTIEYDPNRNSKIALLVYSTGERSYIICPFGLSVGDLVVSDFSTDIKVGNAMPLFRIPIGTSICCLEFQYCVEREFLLCVI